MNYLDLSSVLRAMGTILLQRYLPSSFCEKRSDENGRKCAQSSNMHKTACKLKSR